MSKELDAVWKSVSGVASKNRKITAIYCHNWGELQAFQANFRRKLRTAKNPLKIGVLAISNRMQIHTYLEMYRTAKNPLNIGVLAIGRNRRKTA